MKEYDVIVLGSGAAGSILGAILARNGARVLIIDERSHPRFTAPGESLPPRAADMLRALAERYGVPEIKTLTTFDNCSRIVNTSFGIHRHYGFLVHKEGRRQDPQEVVQAVTHPRSDAAHLFRQDTDSYLLHAAVRYGCVARQSFRITKLEIDDAGVTVGGADGSTYGSRYVVDTTGHGSPVAEALGLREDPPRFTHRSRSQWTHMIGVRTTDQVFGFRGRADVPPVPWHEGTVYHVFEGGYVWVIPFGNHPRSINQLCSVGLTLSPCRYPGGTAASPQAEFSAVTARFPDLARQFERAEPVREWESAETVQYSAARITGDRWCLLGPAAGYVDPLLSRDLSDTAEIIHLFARRLLDALDADDFAAERFACVERRQQELLNNTSELIESAFISFKDYRLFNAVFRVLAWDAYASTLRLQCALSAFLKDGRDDHFAILEDSSRTAAPGSGQEMFMKLSAEVLACCQAFDGGLMSGPEAAARVIRVIEAADLIPSPTALAPAGERFVHPTPKSVGKVLTSRPLRMQFGGRRLTAGRAAHTATPERRERSMVR